MSTPTHDRGHCGLLLGLLLGLAALTTCVIAVAAYAQEAPTVSWSDVNAWIDRYAAAEGVSAWWMHRIADCEAAGNPYAVGSQGEVGPFQWHPFGLWWSTPAGRAGTSPWDLEQNVAMAAWALARGYARHWSCA